MTFLDPLFVRFGIGVVIFAVAVSSWALCAAASDAEDEAERIEIERTKRAQRWQVYCEQREARKRQAS